MKKASDILKEAASVIEERGKLRDKSDGERSMSRAVQAYNALCGSRLDSELNGWLFMICLKMARATAGKTHEDDYADICGYGALAAECVLSKKDRKEALDELTRISEEIGLYSIPERGNSVDNQGKNEVIIPSGNVSERKSEASGNEGESERCNATEQNEPQVSASESKTNADWIEWKGGDCPVNRHERVEVRFRNGEINNEMHAGIWHWSWTEGPDGYDIIAYRVVKE